MTMATEAEYRPFRRDIDAAARLYLQHWICYSEVGFLIHPSIPLSAPDLKIADVACGTGIWLIELAALAPKSAQLDGFDISDAHFPPKDELPEKVTLGYLDMLKDLPEQFVGKYDVVHVRGVVMYVFNDDPGKVLRCLMALLKPGGYLCWDELDLSVHHPKTTLPDVSHAIADKMEGFGKMWFQSQNISFFWLKTLDEILAAHGFDGLAFHSQTVSHAKARPWTIMQLLANRDFIENDIIPLCEAGKMPVGSPSANEWRAMSEGLVRECMGGVRMIADIVYFVGRKTVATG